MKFTIPQPAAPASLSAKPTTTSTATTGNRFNALWDELLGKSPTPEQLLTIANVVPELRERAWKKFAETHPDKSQLLYLLHDHHIYGGLTGLIGATLMELYPEYPVFQKVMTTATDHNLPDLAVQAAEKIISCENTAAASPVRSDDLIYIIERITQQSTKDKAAHILLDERDADSKNSQTLCTVMSWIPSLCEKAAKIVLAKDSPSTREMTTAVHRVPSLRLQVWEKAKQCDPIDLFVIETIMKSCPDLRLQAGELILAQPIPDEKLFSPLFEVAKCNQAFCEEVWERLSVIELSDTWLQAIARDVPTLAERALARVKPPVRDANGIYDEILELNCRARIREVFETEAES